MRFLLYIVCLIFISGCSSIEHDRYLRVLGIDIEGDYKVINEEVSPAIGDLIIEFDIKLGENAFVKVVEQIESHPLFQKLDSLETYQVKNRGYSEKIEENLYYQNGMYYKDLIIPDSLGSGYERYSLVLYQDSILSFHYNDE